MEDLKEIKKSLRDLKRAQRHLDKAIDDNNESAKEVDKCWIETLFETSKDVNG